MDSFAQPRWDSACPMECINILTLLFYTGLRDVTLTSDDGTKGFKFGANGIEWDDKSFGGWVGKNDAHRLII